MSSPEALPATLPEALPVWPEHRPPWVLGLACVLLLVLLLGLGRAPLFDVDEGAFSEATREMLVSGDWGHTTLNGTDRFDKPIGVYWLQALSAQVFGLSEWAMRLPSALATWLAAMAVAAFVVPRWGWQAGALAAVVHVSSFGSWAMAHAATADAVLGLCLMLSALDLWRYLAQADVSALRRMALWVGLGLVIKGPVAVLLPAAALFLGCLAEWRWQPLWRALADGRAWLTLTLVAAPWYAYALWRHGHAFIEGFILRHNIERFAAPMEGHSGNWLYFVLVAPLLWMPWSPLLLAWWGRWRSLWQDANTRRALVWAGFVFVFFSVSGTKLPHYGIYAAPGVVVLLAASLAHWRAWHVGLCAALLLVWQAALLGSPVAWMAWPAQAVASWQSGASWPGNAWAYAGTLWPVALAWAVLALVTGVVLQGLKGRPVVGRLGQEGVLASMALLHVVVLTGWVWPWWAQTLQGPVQKLAISARAWPGSVAQVGGNWPSFAFYRQQAMVTQAEQADMLLMPVQRAAAYPQRPLLAQEQGMVLLGKAPVQAKP